MTTCLILAPTGLWHALGCSCFPAVALLMTIWELFVDDVHAPRRHESHPSVKRLVNWCFYASIGLALCEVAHAGGILTFESSTAQQKAKLETIGEARRRLPEPPLGLPSKPLDGKRRR